MNRYVSLKPPFNLHSMNKDIFAREEWTGVMRKFWKNSCIMNFIVKMIMTARKKKADDNDEIVCDSDSAAMVFPVCMY